MVKRGGLPEVGPLGSFLPVSHVIKTKPPDCLPGQVREVKPDEEHNERERCWLALGLAVQGLGSRREWEA